MCVRVCVWGGGRGRVTGLLSHNFDKRYHIILYPFLLSKVASNHLQHITFARPSTHVNAQNSSK